MNPFSKMENGLNRCQLSRYYHTIKMLQSIVNSVKTNKFNELVYSVHLFDKINYHRVASRVRQTVDHPETPMKVVLFEYDYTKLCDVNKGVIPGRLEVIPGTSVHVQYVVHTDSFKDLMQTMFCTNPGFSWFHRNRRDNNGKTNLTRRQVVLTYTPPPVQETIPSPVLNAVEENQYNDMPPLIPLSNYVPQPPPRLNLLNPNLPFNVYFPTTTTPSIWSYNTTSASLGL